MPKQTFYNLQKDKQKRIVDAAKKEFSKNNFYEASINKIIKDAGIPRGSFYQYFENKEDIFLYLLEHCINLMLEEVVRRCKDRQSDVFQLYLLIFDVITEENFAEDYRDFISNAISNINIKLIRDLSKVLAINDCNYDKGIDRVIKIVTYDNFKCNDKEYILNVHSILSANVMHYLVAYFTDANSLEKLRNELIRQFELIKYGVVK